MYNCPGNQNWSESKKSKNSRSLKFCNFKNTFHWNLEARNIFYQLWEFFYRCNQKYAFNISILRWNYSRNDIINLQNTSSFILANFICVEMHFVKFCTLIWNIFTFFDHNLRFSERDLVFKCRSYQSTKYPDDHCYDNKIFYLCFYQNKNSKTVELKTHQRWQ